MIFSKIFFPARCPFCNTVVKANDAVCDNCIKEIFIDNYKQKLKNGCICISAFPHSGIYRKAILNYKYYNYKQFYESFAIILKQVIDTNTVLRDAEIYTSVPMYKTKLEKRGFDQVKLVAKKTAKLERKQYLSLLEQVEENRSQHELSRSERIKNVKEIYGCSDKDHVRGKKILIFDDVVTTGSTLYECSKILLKNGAENVFCITINYQNPKNDLIP